MHVAGQQAGEHACCVQGLQQVVHGSVHKAGFVAVGFFGLTFGLSEVMCALLHTPLQCIGQRAQFPRCIFVAGDVCIAGDKATIGQWVATNFQHRAVAFFTFVQMGPAAAQMAQAALDGLFHRCSAQQATLGVKAQQIFNRLANAHHFRGVAKEGKVA